MRANDVVPDQVHLVGSIGLPTVEEVFRVCGTTLGRRLKRIPDGEVGGRRLWISWQLPLLRSMPFLQNVDPAKGIFSPMRLAEGATPEDIFFGELGYAREARASYLDFLDASRHGDIARDVRFMVALPTPFAVIRPFTDVETFKVLEKPYTQAMIEEVARICRAIPHEDLAIQWDVCIEMLIWDGSSEGWRWPYGGDGKSEILERLKLLATAIPDDVELGFHLCYGDLDAKHFFEPKGVGAMVDLSNSLMQVVPRKVQWLHMPVPRSRMDDDYFAGLDGLQLKPETEIYLGLVHPQDGAEGAAKRVRAARAHLKAFGISTECGIARVRSPELVEKIIKICAEASREPVM
jgi:hypothetical protein